MLEKPAVQDDKIVSCLTNDFGLRIASFAFLPLGNDLNTAVYRANSIDGTPYFVKLRSGVFDELTVTLPKWLGDQGITQIISPLAARTGQLWARLDEFSVLLYPFIAGRNAYQVDFSERQWFEFGAALKRIHTAALPPAIRARLPRENYTPQWRESVKASLRRVEVDTFNDPVAIKTAALMRAKHAETLDLVLRAERYAAALQARPPEFILCHSDLHAGNLLIADQGSWFIVDWDNPLLAPKERDLMFFGGGQGFTGHTPQEEVDLFYRGYGPTPIDPAALAYYRFERIVQDIAIYCEQLLLSNAGGEDRDRSFHYLASNFLPGHAIEMAYHSPK